MAVETSPIAVRTWLKRSLVVTLVIANVVVIAALYWVWQIRETVDESIPTIPAEELTALVGDQKKDDEPLVILLVGSDTREGLTDDIEGEFGDFPGERADVIMMLRFDRENGVMQLVSLPRDLKVPKSDGSGFEKINATYARGANAIVEAVGDISGIGIDHYIEIDFVSFVSIVDALGGVELYFPLPARDLKSGLSVGVGNQKLNGAQALAFARSRSYQQLIDGQWSSLSGSDLERTSRQQQLIFAILNQVSKPDNLLGMQGLIAELGSDLTTDSALDFDLLVDLAWTFREFSTENLEAITLPVEFEGTRYLVAKEPEASAVFAAFASGQPLTPPNTAPPRILVLNANGREGAAAAAGDLLAANGFVAETDNSPESVADTLVVANPGWFAEAQDIVEVLGVGSAVDGVVPSGSDIVVYLGRDATIFGTDA
ncbi:MAG: LCP family protein [Acidimicrobiia bacterium]|nr:LCP family protein [Acidimicrobiia bacterium]NNL47666.1 LCP family protein [Acidimicrobiia bacterium]